MPGGGHRASSAERHEFVVVGAGVLGLSAAWALSRRGHEVVVLDVGAPGHAGSGSKGAARIFRASYPDLQYARMARQSLRLWHDLERESGQELLHMTGGVNLGRDLDSLASALRDADIAFEQLTQQESTARFPHLRVRGSTLFEPAAGVLVADACLAALIHTGTFVLRAPCTVRALHDERDGVSVLLDDGGTVHADAVVNCAGTATLSIMDGLPVGDPGPASLQQVVYLEPLQTVAVMPVFIEWGDDMVYGLPVVGRNRLKLSHHTVGPAVQGSLHDAHMHVDDPELMQLLTEAAARLLPAFNPVPVATERCVYDNTADSDFMVDRVGHVVIGCGTSGHAFKFGPLLGEVLADLAVGAPPGVDLERFALRRARGAGATPAPAPEPADP